MTTPKDKSVGDSGGIPNRGKLSKARFLSTSMGLMTCIALGVAASEGCLNRPIEPVEPKTTDTVIEKITQTGVDKIDIILALDNSASMLDKQKILSNAVPSLVNRLVNPLCVDSKQVAQAKQPTDPTLPCDTGFTREFPAILDINIGVISSSLGGDGSASCPTGGSPPNPANDDQGHLITRVPAGSTTTTYQGEGFLAWDPSMPPKRTPAGISDSSVLTKDVTDLVLGTGQNGCGYEHQLESVTRFLVDPNPYASITVTAGNAVPTGIDQTLLTERANFLRSNSLLAVIMLSDENDCSINTLNQQAYLVLGPSGFFAGSPICATDPNNACCYSCGLTPPAGCDPCVKKNLDPVDDHVNLKCWNQKKRYGYDFLFPVKRYVNAFSQTKINPANADLSVADGDKAGVANPIFTDLSGTSQPVRDPSLVFFAGIVGVPYQAVAKDPTDLGKGFKTYDELQKDDFFAQYVGDPDKHIEPTNPIMIEAIANRGVPTSAPNGGDRTISAKDDVQYACISDLPESQSDGADCKAAGPDNPLCTAGGEPQIKFKGYPCLRELSVIQGLLGQGITASICPSVTDPAKTADADYGYNPAVGSIIDRLKTKLGGQCLPRQLKADNSGTASQGDVPCIVIEASHTDAGQSDCSGAGRAPVDSTHAQAVVAAKADPSAPKDSAAWNSFCEITQLTGDPAVSTSPKAECQNLPVDQLPATGLDGWCYIDAASTPPVGNPDLVAQCASNEKHLVRFVGKGQVASGATALITCSGESGN